MKRDFFACLLGGILLFSPWSIFCAEIHQAVYSGNMEEVKKILLADPKQISSKEKDDLLVHSAKMARYQEILRFDFIFNKIHSYLNPNLKGYTPLMIAVVVQNPEMVELLLSFQANVNERNSEGLNSVHLASIGGDIKVLRLLLQDKKARISVPDYHGLTPLSLAAALENPEILSLFIQMGLPVNGQDRNGVTPLMYVALNGQIEMAENLITAGSQVNVKDRVGNTPIMYAAFYGDTGLIAYLVDRGAILGVKNARGLTPLLYAAISGQLRTLKFLLQKGANPKQLLNQKVTVSSSGKEYPKGAGILAIAQINDDEEMINYLSSEF